MPQYTQQEIEKLFNALPSELKSAIFSEETAQTISNVCQRNQIPDKTSQLATIVGNILLRITPLENLKEEIKNALGINDLLAAQITTELNHLIFLPVAAILNQPITKSLPNEKRNINTITEEVDEGEENLAAAEPEVMKQKKQPTADLDQYRETIE